MIAGLGPQEWTVIALSIRVAVVAMIAALPVAVGVAYVLARKRFPGRQILNGIVHLPLVLPPVVTGYLLLVIFSKNAPVGAFLEATFGISFGFRWTGAALAAAVMAFPLMVRAIRLGIEAVDPGLEEAAATLGASRLRIFMTVTLPLITPSVLAGAVLGFAKALGEFGATITFVAAIPGQTQTIPSAIYGLLQVPGAEGAVLGLVIVAVILAMGALLLSEWLAQRAVRKVGR
ncbi:molybdate ABC transporter permease subunit [Loktanella sp. S4079]|uniref:molybdate ABC transporter permease subunit n=1 Tax=Loktanella sp. S4079 TaxID=579483 RepID=UPI0005FA2B2F|nr:molybdate ABC transporter permease subunit [Loktanella sp. S4079]KJZ20889.1 molybdate ABC transporter permease [Loktanella sp. S4079]